MPRKSFERLYRRLVFRTNSRYFCVSLCFERLYRRLVFRTYNRNCIWNITFRAPLPASGIQNMMNTLMVGVKVSSASTGVWYSERIQGNRKTNIVSSASTGVWYSEHYLRMIRRTDCFERLYRRLVFRTKKTTSSEVLGFERLYRRLVFRTPHHAYRRYRGFERLYRRLVFRTSETHEDPQHWFRAPLPASGIQNAI